MILERDRKSELRLEAKRCAALLRSGMPDAWWHGGPTGLPVGTKLIPASEQSGWQAQPSMCFDPLSGHEHFVFITTSVVVAKFYAWLSYGSVYRVQPHDLTFLPGIAPRFEKLRSKIGASELSDYTLARRCGAEFVCTSAEILEVLA